MQVDTVEQRSLRSIWQLSSNNTSPRLTVPRSAFLRVIQSQSMLEELRIAQQGIPFVKEWALAASEALKSSGQVFLYRAFDAAD